MTTPITPASARTSHLSLVRAYGAPAAGHVASVAAGAPTRATTPLRRVDAVIGDSGPEVAAKIAPATTAKIESLVAAKVPGRADFTASASASERAAGAPMPFYRAPSDRNEAATAIMIGRGLDVTG